MPRYIDADLIPYSIVRNLEDEQIAITDKRHVDKVPTADVAPVVHAHWIPKHQTSLGLYPFECSRCERWEVLEFTNDINNMPYCHCGAKMDEEEEE